MHILSNRSVNKGHPTERGVCWKVVVVDKFALRSAQMLFVRERHLYSAVAISTDLTLLAATTTTGRNTLQTILFVAAEEDLLMPHVV